MKKEILIFTKVKFLPKNSIKKEPNFLFEIVMKRNNFFSTKIQILKFKYKIKTLLINSYNYIIFTELSSI